MQIAHCYDPGTKITDIQRRVPQCDCQCWLTLLLWLRRQDDLLGLRWLDHLLNWLDLLLLLLGSLQGRLLLSIEALHCL